MKIIETERLVLRPFTLDDAKFIVELVNDPSWLRFIGDRGVRNEEDARTYLHNGPIAMYERLGFGLYLVALKAGNVPIGMCGLIKRDTLPDVDLGFAFLPKYRASGYAGEAATATLRMAREKFGLGRIVAITSPSNVRSIKLLQSIGFVFEKEVALEKAEPVSLFAVSL